MSRWSGRKSRKMKFSVPHPDKPYPEEVHLPSFAELRQLHKPQTLKLFRLGLENFQGIWAQKVLRARWYRLTSPLQVMWHVDSKLGPSEIISHMLSFILKVEQEQSAKTGAFRY